MAARLLRSRSTRKLVRSVEANTTVSYSVGQELVVLTRQVTQETINRYAEASGDHNPLHVDPDFAATTRFAGPIAHGMLVLAYVSEAMTTAFGEAWLRSGRLKARFRGAARPGDVVIVSGRVVKVEEHPVVCEVWAKNGTGEVLISADAGVSE